MTRRLAVLALLVAVSPVQAQPVTSPEHSLEDLGFLAGRWAGASGDSRSEYFWTSPDAGTILGTSRRMKGQETLVSYFFIIESTDSGNIYRFKHFNDDYTTYEDRNDEGPREFRADRARRQLGRLQGDQQAAGGLRAVQADGEGPAGDQGRDDARRAGG